MWTAWVLESPSDTMNMVAMTMVLELENPDSAASSDRQPVRTRATIAVRATTVFETLDCI